jgi:uncharacterized protein
MTNPRIFDYMLVKLASRCNLACSYCYWFRDPSVYEKPGVMPRPVVDAFLEKLEMHIREHALKRFSVLFHGGEPTLFGKSRFAQFVESLSAVKERTGCEITFSMTTNGVLVDQEWARLFRDYGVSVTVSIDGSTTVSGSTIKGEEVSTE